MDFKTEDQVRDEACNILGFKDDKNAKSGVGQITTFNQLGIKGDGKDKKPDGWYLPKDKGSVAIILETKNSNEDLGKKKWIDEIKQNCQIVMDSGYTHVIGLLHNGYKTTGFKNNTPIDVPNELQEKEYYFKIFTEDSIDKELIYTLTARINNCLHSEFGIKNLYHRMIFTACALVAKRYGATLVKGMNYETFHTCIHSTLAKSLEDSRNQNQKVDLLLQVYSEIRMNSTENQEAIDNFIKWVGEISDCLNSNKWRGEDVMGIFFNEFNRYKKKTDAGQIFTPDHITSFMYRLINVTKNDYIGDFTCGSGAFLVKAMSNMIEESGGVDTNKAKEIKKTHLFGIEFDREIYALACANMLIHKDGKTNLEHLDTRSEAACKWIKSKPITKVLMNPPYENKYGCIEIVKNTLDNVKKGTDCAFILPDKKLEKVSQRIVKNILENHRLKMIIKLPEPLFFGVGITTSIFIFKAGEPQNNEEIFGCYIEEDGLETVKNQGRHDVKNRWKDIEDYWINSIRKLRDEKYNTAQWIKPSKHLSYQMPEKPFEIFEEDFRKTAMDYLMFKKGIDVKEFGEKLLNSVMYSSNIEDKNNQICISLNKKNIMQESERDIENLKNICNSEKEIVLNNWKDFKIGGENGLFEVTRPNARSAQTYNEGDMPYIASGCFNNGVCGYFEPKDKGDFDKGNCITVSPVDGYAFYQKDNFLGRGGAGSSIIILRRDNLNEYIGKFICTVIRKTCKDWSYSNMGNKDKFRDTIIKLPTNSKGEPDWKYMENYMKNIMKNCESKLDNLSLSI